mmetsp:Transcript_15911/g.34353  ORF Transcript_15911/g.34353 Transcript_15911/m.34353 type:complete len:377 (+) Transcript_15911:10-1140(+)
MADQHNIVVLDYGSKTFKAGFAYSFPSEDEPRVVTPTAVEVTQPPNKQDAASDGHYDVHFPVHRGQIQNFDELESLIQYTLYELLGWERGDEGNVVISEPVLTSRADREQLSQLMFEVFNVNGLFIQDQAVLSLFAVGKVSGCVVDIGHGKVDISSVNDGQINSSSVRRLPLGGEDLTRHLEKLLHQKGTTLPSAHDVELLKEMCCQASESGQDYDRMLRKGTSDADGMETTSYKLPDGQEITLTTEGYQTAEALFQPGLMGVSSPGISDATFDCIQTQYEGGSRRQVYESLLVCGGGSGIPGVSGRILKEVKSLAPPSTSLGMCAIPEYLPQRTCKFAAWVGGAVVAKVVLQQNQFVGKGDYDEAGPYAMHRKCS